MAGPADNVSEFEALFGEFDAKEIEAQPALVVPQPDANGEFASPADGAKFMASLGFYEVPLSGPQDERWDNPGKNPAINGNNWQKKGSKEFAQIDEWATIYPGCNFGSLAKAELGQFFDFEVDSTEARSRYEKATGKKNFDIALEIRSGNGLHRWHLHSEASLAIGNISQKDGGDFSLRASEQMGVSPGSVHAKTGKQYRVVRNIVPTEMSVEQLSWLKSHKAEKKTNPADDNEPILEGKRDDSLASIAGRCRNAGLNYEEMVDHLSRVNIERCVPPVKDEDIERIARSYARYPAGHPENDIIIFNDKPAAPPLNPISLWVRATTFADIAETKMEWLVPGLLVKGETTMMTGDFGSFKSYMSYFLADAISSGGLFVHRSAQMHPVLVLDRENSKATVSLRRYLVGNLRDSKNARILSRFTSPQAPAVTDPELLEVCRSVKPFIIIDSMQDFHPGRKENDVDDMTEFSQEVNGLVDAGAVGVLLIHHVPKNGKGRGGQYRGSTAIPGGVGGALFVEKKDRLGVVISGFKTRDGEDSLIELQLTFPTDAEVTGKSGRVTYKVVKSGMDRTAELHESIVNFVSQFGLESTLSANAIAKHLGGDRNELYRAVTALEFQGRLMKSAKGYIRATDNELGKRAHSVLGGPDATDLSK